MNELAIVLQPNEKQFLYLQIYDYITSEIKMRKLLPGEKLPSTRFLAQYLQVSRNTVELAYEQLIAEGYITSIPYKGYYVNKIESLVQVTGSKGDQGIYHTLNQVETATVENEQMVYDFSPTKVQMQGFPFSVWKKIQKEALAENENKLFALGDPRGELSLRREVARYLHASRGILCEQEQIIIGAGNDYLLMLLEKILSRDQVVAIEEYTYGRAVQIFESFSYSLVSVPIDEGGIHIEALYHSNATVAYVMPAHQFPTGISMPIMRRMELLEWAKELEGRYIIEDDYDSEFRYKGRPMKALQSLDQHGTVIYMGTFSKSIAPAIRISYMVLPMKLVEAYEAKAHFYSSTVSIIDQTTLEIFIREGYFERHLNKMRKRYKEKHDLLVSLLKSYAPMITITGEQLGLHIIITYHGMESEEELLEEAYKQKIQVYPMSAYAYKRKNKKLQKPKFLIGYASIEAEEIRTGIQLLMDIWKCNTGEGKQSDELESVTM